MVIGEKFVWGHLGKTGGDSVKKMFDILGKKHFLFADKHSSPLKHQTFFEKEAALGYDLTKTRKRILSIRRLPNWALSYVFHKQRTFDRPVDFEQLYRGMLFDHYQDNDITKPIYLPIDVVLNTQICGRVDFWLRTEYLAEDFIAVMSQFVDISWIKKNIIKIIKRNKNSHYNKDVRKYFSDEQLRNLYSICPLWSIIESSVYDTNEDYILKRDSMIASCVLVLDGAIDIIQSSDTHIRIIGWLCLNINGNLYFPSSISVRDCTERIYDDSVLTPNYRTDLTDKLNGFVGFDVCLLRERLFNLKNTEVRLYAHWGTISVPIFVSEEKKEQLKSVLTLI